MDTSTRLQTLTEPRWPLDLCPQYSLSLSSMFNEMPKKCFHFCVLIDVVWLDYTVLITFSDPSKWPNWIGTLCLVSGLHHTLLNPMCMIDWPFGLAQRFLLIETIGFFMVGFLFGCFSFKRARAKMPTWVYWHKMDWLWYVRSRIALFFQSLAHIKLNSLVSR